jgi:putative transposase
MEEHIAMALRQGDAGTPVAEIVCKLKAIREENRRLKSLVADLSIDKTNLQEALREKW